MRNIQLNIPDEVDLKDYDFSMIIASFACGWCYHHPLNIWSVSLC